jgi:hypothetical protein
MKRHWRDDELAEHWSLSLKDLSHLAKREPPGKIGYGALLMFSKLEGRFPKAHRELPGVALAYLAQQLELEASSFRDYDLTGRSSKRDRQEIRAALGYRPFALSDVPALQAFLRDQVVPSSHKTEHLQEAALRWCHERQLEPPTEGRLARIIGSAIHAFEQALFTRVSHALSAETKRRLDALLDTPTSELGGLTATLFQHLAADPGRLGLHSIVSETRKLDTVRALNLPEELFTEIAPAVLERYRQRAATEPPRELRRHPDGVRYRSWRRFVRFAAGS